MLLNKGSVNLHGKSLQGRGFRIGRGVSTIPINRLGRVKSANEVLDSRWFGKRRLKWGNLHERSDSAFLGAEKGLKGRPYFVKAKRTT